MVRVGSRKPRLALVFEEVVVFGVTVLTYMESRVLQFHLFARFIQIAG
jgi:hypothetical protein